MSATGGHVGPTVDTGPGAGPLILGFNWAFASLAIIAVAVRMWLRRKVGHGLDDWIMVVATGMLIVYAAMLTQSVAYGLGRKYDSISTEEFKKLMYWELLAQFFVNLQPFVSRWSIAVFLIRIFGMTRPWFKYFLIVWVALMAVDATLANVFTFTNIDPIEAWWDPTIPSRYRFNPKFQYYTSLGVCWQAAISDLAFVIFPVSFVWNLQLPLRKKIGLIALLSGSLIAFCASLAKIVFATLNVRGESRETDGPTSGGVGGVMWVTSGVEQGLVIVLGSAPSFGPLAHMNFLNGMQASLIYLVTLGRRSRKSSRSQSVYHKEDVELGPPRRLSEDDRGSGRVPARFADGSLATTDETMGKYIRRTDEFVVLQKKSQGHLY